MPALSNAARDVALLLSQCPQQAWPWHILESLLDEQQLWNGCLELTAGGYLQATARGGPLKLVRLPRNLRGARCVQLRRHLIQTLLQACKEVPPGGGLRETAAWLDYLPLFEQLASGLSGHVPDAELGWPFVALSRLSEANADRPRSIYWSARALAVLQARLGPDHLDTATACNNLAAALHQSGHYDQAEQLYGQALSIRQQRLGAEHPHLVAVLSNLAGACRCQGKLELCMGYLERAFSIAGLQSLPLLLQLAEACAEFGQLQRALAMCRAALAECPPGHSNRAFVLQNFGGLLHKLGQPEQAHLCLGQALELQRQHLGSQHPAVATLLNNWGVLFFLDGDLPRACDLLAQALEIRQQNLGPASPETRATAANLAAARARLAAAS